MQAQREASYLQARVRGRAYRRDPTYGELEREEVSNQTNGCRSEAARVMRRAHPLPSESISS